MNDTLLNLICELAKKDVSNAVSTGVKTPPSFEIGKSYLIRTVTMMYTGKVTAINDFNIWLEDAAWIADSGRYNAALVNGTLEEVEPYPSGVGVSLQSIVDFAYWDHALPREVK